MKTTTSFVHRLGVQSVVFFVLLFTSLAISAQTFYLEKIVMGNRYAPDNVRFSYETPWYYDWSIKTNRVDAWGGDIELHVSVKSIPGCKKVYHITWAFSKDVSTVSCGEKIFVDVVNQPITGGNCQWDWVDINPSSLYLNNGASGMTWAEASQDPKASWREYVFLHHPRHTINGEPQFIDHKFIHLHHAEHLEIVVCSRPDMARDANGGNFHFNLDGRGIFFDIDYVFSKEPSGMQTPATVATASLQNPIIQHNIQNAEGVYWMSIQVPGILQSYSGKQIQLVIRFVDAYGNLLPGNRGDLRYVDAAGYAATGSGLVNVTSNQFDLGTLQIWMPYYSLNLPNSGGTQSHDLTAFAELFVDGKMVAQSERVPLRVNW